MTAALSILGALLIPSLGFTPLLALWLVGLAVQLKECRTRTLRGVYISLIVLISALITFNIACQFVLR